LDCASFFLVSYSPFPDHFAGGLVMPRFGRVEIRLEPVMAELQTRPGAEAETSLILVQYFRKKINKNETFCIYV
jgi:hypothetical protein